MIKRSLVVISFIICLWQYSFAQKKELSVIGYFAGRSTALDSFPVQQLTHLIFSFGHLNGNRLWISNANDTACIEKMVLLKQKSPGLKIIISLGGWGGCRNCSPVFSTKKGRKEFARSTKELMEYFHTDGIDLDWEYPAIAGYPGHAYSMDDKRNFSLLVSSLRHALGKEYEISFAAGGFDLFIDSSIEWKKVMRKADRVNIMSYDLVHGASTVSGHHTPLYSTPEQKQSTDNAVNRILAAGVPANKIVIGAAFYARFFKVTDTANKGLYQPASFYHGVSYSRLYDSISAENGFVSYWDETAGAPYAYNIARQLFVTYDDSASIRLKTKYAMDRNLNGIMFWQLVDDRFDHGLLDAMYRAKMEGEK